MERNPSNSAKDAEDAFGRYADDISSDSKPKLSEHSSQEIHLRWLAKLPGREMLRCMLHVILNGESHGKEDSPDGA